MANDSVRNILPDSANRRRFLSMIGAMGMAGLAGCSGDDDDTPTDTGTGGNGNGETTDTDAGGNGDTTETDTPESGTDTPTETDAPNQDFPSDPPTVVTFSGGGSVSPGETTTLTATAENPYVFPIQSVRISLNAPNADWTVEATGETTLGTIDTSTGRELSWDITAPEGADGQFTLSGSISYESEIDQVETEFSESITVLNLGGVPVDGIEAYFPFDSETATNVITGTEASVTGMPTTDAAGIVDGAWEFTTSGDPRDNRSSTTDAVTSGETLPLNGETATVGAWVNVTGHEAFGRLYQVGGSVADAAAASGGHEVIFHGNTEAANDLLVADGNGRVVGGGGAFPDLSTETWYFVVLVRDGTDYRLHVFDETGELEASPATGSHDTAPPTSSGELLVMMSGDDSETAGRIDEVYGYSRALSEGEVTDLYDNTGGSA